MSGALAAGAVLALAVFGSATGAGAQGLITSQKLSASLANKLVGETVAVCAQKGYAVTAVVVDLDGVRQAVLRGNGAPIHTLDNAFFCRRLLGRPASESGRLLYVTVTGPTEGGPPPPESVHVSLYEAAGRVKWPVVLLSSCVQHPLAGPSAAAPPKQQLDALPPRSPGYAAA